ncbi:MAG TPA: decaprenyl-phosphate phosphoribosyltransferase [Chloroflexota bacterium]|nr:decaprenyl-phosphate phosphoribosyltransferase [Chloroflexota bacterium]
MQHSLTGADTRAQPAFAPTDLLRAVRPKQWVKNAFVFAALVFSDSLTHPGLIARSVAAFLLFCLLTSGIYLLNDVADAEADRKHPLKRRRPIASGKLSSRLAVAVAIAAFAVGLSLSVVLAWQFGLVAAGYVALMLAYTVILKHLVLIDVFAIAGGFVLRAAGGAYAIHVSISPWLYLCTILISLFLGFGKRRHELLLLEGEAGGHRRNLDEYTGPLLDDMINIVAGATIIAYSLYTFFGPAGRHSHLMMVTIPFVLYGIFRYLLLIHRTDIAGTPEEAVWRDPALLVDVVLWVTAAAAVLYLGP